MNVSTVYDSGNVNSSAVMGAITAAQNLPLFSSKTYSALQNTLDDFWRETALDEMSKAVHMEKEFAIECGEVTKDGIPFITVVCDGVWAKRS